MALLADAGTVASKASRIVSIIRFVQLSSFTAQDNDDLTLSLSPAQKQALQDKVAALQADIKAIAIGW